MAVMFMWQAGQDKLPFSGSLAKKKTVHTHVGKPLIVERKGERIIWRLKADKAEQQLTGTMHLLQPELDLFTETGKTIPVTGQQAWFTPLSKQVRFKGDVEVRYGEWHLYSDSLRYEEQKNVLFIPGAFRIKGKTTRIRGRNLTGWRDMQHVRVENGVWIEDTRPIQMQP